MALSATLMFVFYFTACTALQVVYDSEIRNCPCSIDLQLNVKRGSLVSIQIVPQKRYSQWKSSNNVDSIVEKTNDLAPGNYHAKYQVEKTGEYAVIVHATKHVSVVANVKPPKPLNPICRLSLSFRTAPLPVTARHARLLPVVTERIINGALATGITAKQLSYTVLLRYGNNVCTGSVIAPTWILTAAHCRLSEGTKVFLNRNSNTVRRVTQIYRHPKFSFTVNVKYHDVALLKLDRPLIVTPLKLYDGAVHNLVHRFARESGFGSIIHWKKRTDMRLRVTDTPVVSLNTCRAELRKKFKNKAAELLDPYHHLCTDSRACGVAACFGDSGSPLCVPGASGEHVQIGVASYIFDSCSRVPDVYMNIASQVKWIRSVTNGAVRFTNRIEKGGHLR